MTTSLTTRPPRRSIPSTDATSSRPALRSSRVVQAAVGMVLVQLGFRAWATYSSWFTLDDYNFMSRMANDGAGLDVAMQPYAGHIMPAGMYLSWFANEVAPFDYRLTATMLLLLQLLADVGLVVMLVRLFGARWGILPPLAVYLFCVISVPVAVWWAAGVNQIPLQIVLFWSLATHVEYLRTRRARHLIATMLWLAFGLLFYEKTILVLGALGIVTLAYFTTGDLRTRLAEVWDRYRPALFAYVALGVAYLAIYAHYALNFSPKQAGNNALGDVITNMVFEGYLPAVVGGPLEWDGIGQFSLASPRDLVVLASLVVWFLVLREIHLSRTHSLRAWFLPGFFLVCDVVLVLAGRASFVGALISLDFRYQGETPAVTAIGLACATMAILGARERVDKRAESVLLDHPRRVAAATAAVVILSIISSLQYVTYWVDTMQARPYFKNVLGTVEKAKQPIPLVDTTVPGFVMWELGYPANLLSHLLLAYGDRIDYLEIATDELNVVDSKGNVVPAVVTSVRNNVSGSAPGCGYGVQRQSVSIPLNGPVAFGGWWVRIGYLSSARSSVVVTAGTAKYSTVVEPGVHALYLSGGGQFDSVEISGLSDGVTLCTNDVTVGRLRPVTEPEAPA
jgi:hypothetical protein